MVKKLLTVPVLGIMILLSFQATYAQFTSNLPIVKITTPGAIGTAQIQGTMDIIDNASGTNNDTDPSTFTGMIGIKLRGTTGYPKQSYSIETWSAATVSLDTALLGMPSENDWVLLASYPDRSFVRNILSFKLHDQMGRYAPRMRHCEVIVNGQYAGIYEFGEKIKRTVNRLDLAKLTPADNFGENMTGGYIWKIDDEAGSGWVSSIAPPYATTQQINFIYEYPDAGDITPAQAAYAKSYVDSFETAMSATNFQDTSIGWRKFGAVNGFADFMIIQELSRNYEAYRINTYLYKDKSKKMRPGPTWGFETAWKNTVNCNSAKDTGWCYNFGGACGTEPKLPAFWWEKLTTDTAFSKEMKCAYINYRKPGNVLDTVNIFHIIDSVSALLNANGALTRNFTQWPIWAVPVVNEPTPMATDYAQEIAALKQFIVARLSWLDTKWVSLNCPNPVGLVQTDFSNSVQVYPNPANDIVQVEVEHSQLRLFTANVLSLQGQLLMSETTATGSCKFNIQHLPAGIYAIQIKSENGMTTRKLIKE
ncbi:MAG: CotH kinase family protein [Chitinophagaceae bacterium]|nr:CotH kinase family protein [Chitinophagaceae bacterium]